MKRYIVATEKGTRPSKPLNGDRAVAAALDTCKRGWPEFKWRSFLLDYQSGSCKADRPTLTLDSSIKGPIRESLIKAMELSYGGEFELK